MKKYCTFFFLYLKIKIYVYTYIYLLINLQIYCFYQEKKSSLLLKLGSARSQPARIESKLET